VLLVKLIILRFDRIISFVVSKKKKKKIEAKFKCEIEESFKRKARYIYNSIDKSKRILNKFCNNRKNICNKLIKFRFKDVYLSSKLNTIDCLIN